MRADLEGAKYCSITWGTTEHGSTTWGTTGYCSITWGTIKYYSITWGTTEYGSITWGIKSTVVSAEVPPIREYHLGYRRAL